MTKVESLLNQNKYLKLSLIDVIKLIDPSDKSKYVELIYKLGPKDRLIRKEESSEIRSILIKHYHISEKKLSEYNDYECAMIYFLIERFYNQSDLGMMKKLHELSTDNLIDNFDISKISSYQDIANYITLAEIKKMDKESEKMTKVLLRNENWLILRPLSHKASLKYGASTKWCTASENDPHYFMKYAKRGILIYIINMKTGNKTAFFQTTNNDEDKETSFWNVVDQRVDSIETDLTQEVFNVIRQEMKEKKSNWDLLNKSQKESMELELYGREAKLINIEDALRTVMGDEPISEQENEIAPQEFDIAIRPQRAVEYINVEMTTPIMRG